MLRCKPQKAQAHVRGETVLGRLVVLGLWVCSGRGQGLVALGFGCIEVRVWLRWGCEYVWGLGGGQGRGRGGGLVVLHAPDWWIGGVNSSLTGVVEVWGLSYVLSVNLNKTRLFGCSLRQKVVLP